MTGDFVDGRGGSGATVRGSDPGEDVARLRAALGGISRHAERQVSGGLLTRTQVSVLTMLTFAGPLRASELAEREGINPTMLSRIAGKLEDLGLVERRADSIDRRAVVVAATEAGATLARQLRDERTSLFAATLRQLDPSCTAAVFAAIPALESLAALLRAGDTGAAHRQSQASDDSQDSRS